MLTALQKIDLNNAMLTAYEQNLIAVYLSNAVSSLTPRDGETRRLIDWIVTGENKIAFPSNRNLYRAGRRDPGVEERKISVRDLFNLEKTLREKCSDKTVKADRTTRRLRHLGKTMGLNRTDLDILELGPY